MGALDYQQEHPGQFLGWYFQTHLLHTPHLIFLPLRHGFLLIFRHDYIGALIYPLYAQTIAGSYGAPSTPKRDS